jgi:hypothetical protein
MTTFDDAMAWAGRRLVARAERTTRLRQATTSVTATLWNLLMVLGGLGAITYGVYQLAEWAGWIVGGLCAFAARTFVTWGGTNAAPGR